MLLNLAAQRVATAACHVACQNWWQKPYTDQFSEPVFAGALKVELSTKAQGDSQPAIQAASKRHMEKVYLPRQLPSSAHLPSYIYAEGGEGGGEGEGAWWRGRGADSARCSFF